MAGDQIDVIIADLDAYTRLEIIALTLNVAANLQESPPLGTPVNTGWARANWVPSVGEPKFLPSDDKNPTPAVIAARQQLVEAGRNDVLGWKPEAGTLFVTNSVPYIEPLNAGHSQQSPAGFVQNAIEKAVRETYSAAASKGARNRRAAKARTSKARPKR